MGRPQGLVYGKHEYQAYERYGFRTPSGKVELWSERVAEVGQDPLPAFLEPAESPLSTPDVAADYPLVLTTGARHVAYVASRGRNLPSLRRLMPEPVLDIHPQTAAALGVAEGGRVRVVSPRVPWRSRPPHCRFGPPRDSPAARMGKRPTPTC